VELTLWPRDRVEPQEIIEQKAEGYVDASEFRVAYPDAHAKLRAARDLMAADPWPTRRGLAPVAAKR